MNTLLFIEPYASEGGHKKKHFDVFSENSFSRYPLYCEKQLAEEKTLPNVIPFFDLAERDATLSTEAILEKRMKEWRQVLQASEAKILFVLTAKEVDFEAWIHLLSDDAVIDQLNQKEQKIVIQTEAQLYEAFYKKANFVNRIFVKAKKVLALNFYTPQMAKIAAYYTPDIMAYSHPLPIYDSFIRSSRTSHTERYLTFLGYQDFNKTTPKLVELVKDKTHLDYAIQFYPVKESNYLLFRELETYLKMEDRLVARPLSQAEYVEWITETKVGILNYDSYEYAVRGSGILEEFLLMAKPVVVPKDSWLELFCEENQAAYVAYDESDLNGLYYACFQILNNYERYRHLGEMCAHRLAEKYASASFFDFIEKFSYSNRQELQTLSLKEAVCLRKGTVHFLMRVLEKDFLDGEQASVRELLDQVESLDPHYWKMHFFRSLLDKVELKREEAFNVYGLADYEQKYLDKDSCYSLAFYLKGHYLQKLDAGAPFHDRTFEVSCYDIIFDIYHEPDQIFYQYDKFLYCWEQLSFSVKRSLLNSLYLLKDHSLFQECVSRLLVYAKKEAKTFYELYSLGSSLKKWKMWHEAESVFRLLFRKNAKASGICYHLGDIYLQLGNNMKATELLQECVQLNPLHNRAQKLLNNLVSQS